MKRLPIYATAVLAATAQLGPETDEAICKDRRCVNEVVATQPEQPHAHEEMPEYQGVTEMVAIPSSPVSIVPRNSAAHREWIALFGDDGIERIESLTQYFLQTQ